MSGFSQERLMQVLLAPQIQDAILLGTIAPGDKQLRELTRIPDWSASAAVIGSDTVPMFPRN